MLTSMSAVSRPERALSELTGRGGAGQTGTGDVLLRAEPRTAHQRRPGTGDRVSPGTRGAEQGKGDPTAGPFWGFIT